MLLKNILKEAGKGVGLSALIDWLFSAKMKREERRDTTTTANNLVTVRTVGLCRDYCAWFQVVQVH